MLQICISGFLPDAKTKSNQLYLIEVKKSELKSTFSKGE